MCVYVCVCVRVCGLPAHTGTGIHHVARASDPGQRKEGRSEESTDQPLPLLSSFLSFFSFSFFDILLFESGTTGSRTNQAASFPTPSALLSPLIPPLLSLFFSLSVLGVPGWVFCLCWCADVEFRVARRPHRPAASGTTAASPASCSLTSIRTVCVLFLLLFVVVASRLPDRSARRWRATFKLSL